MHVLFNDVVLESVWADLNKVDVTLVKIIREEQTYEGAATQVQSVFRGKAARLAAARAAKEKASVHIRGAAHRNSLCYHAVPISSVEGRIFESRDFVVPT